MSSTSATNVSPTAPPTTPAANLFALAALFKLPALSAAFFKFGFLRLTCLPIFLALSALSNALVASLYPKVPTLATCVIASVIFPIAFSLALSSKGFISSKIFSTSAAVFVSKPKSINSAPNEIKPSGILISPDATPENAASILLILLCNS